MRNHWDQFYNNSYKNKLLDKGSSFAKFCLKKMQKYDTVIDLACGNARDSKYFYQKGKIETTIKHDEEISKAIYVLNNMDLYDAILRGDSIQ